MARKEPSQITTDSRFTAVRTWFACAVAGTRLNIYRWMRPPISLLSKHGRMTALQVHIPASSLHAETTMSGKASTGTAVGDRVFLRRRGAPEAPVLLNSRPLSHLREIRRCKLLEPPR